MATCGNTSITNEAPKATAPNAVALSSPVTFIYPKQPPKDDGRPLALAALIGGVLDMVMGGEALASAQSAENTWKGMLDGIMKLRGESELRRVDSERDKLSTFEADLKAQLSDWRAKADAEFGKLGAYETKLDTEIGEFRARAGDYWAMLPALNNLLREQLDEYRTRGNTMWSELPTYAAIIKAEIDEHRTKSGDEYAAANALCVDTAIQKLCQYVTCGYTADYSGIANRARADAELAGLTAYNDTCRQANRYNHRRHASMMADVRLATVTAAIGATARAREVERQFMWKTNQDIRFKSAEMLEDMRVKRRTLSAQYDDTANKMAEQRWQDYAKISLHTNDKAIDGDAAQWREFEAVSSKLDGAALQGNEARWKDFSNLYLSQDKRGDEISDAQWKMYSDSALRSFREGGEMLASAAQAYQFLAASIRATAKQGGGGNGAAGALALLATVLPLFSGSADPITIPQIGSFYPTRQECCS